MSKVTKRMRKFGNRYVTLRQEMELLCGESVAACLIYIKEQSIHSVFAACPKPISANKKAEFTTSAISV
jgi:hypothetical protein